VIWVFFAITTLALAGMVFVALLGLTRLLKDKSLRRVSTFDIFTGTWTDPQDEPPESDASRPGSKCGPCRYSNVNRH